MAFSTQKEFFNIPFMNESVDQDCKKACVKLKRYESTVDNRSWASDETKQSRFLSDLVTCQHSSDRGYGEGDFSNRDNQVARSRDVAFSSADANATQSPSTSKYASKIIANKQSDFDDSDADEYGLDLQLRNLTGGDSLLECANINLAEFQKVLNIKTTLEKQLEVSNERLKTAEEENEKIRKVIASKLDSNITKDFYNKIQKFTSSGKLNKNEENEMLQIYQKMENIYKSYEILRAENYYLKRLIEKLTARIALDNIVIEPEKSKDVGYLQNEVNSLRKECLLLRQLENEYQMLKQQQTNKIPPMISEQDADNIKAIIKERNSLREKCKSLRNLEQQVLELKQQTQAAKKQAGNLGNSLSDKTLYINKMEEEIQKMQKYYDDKSQKACYREECLKAQLNDMKDELIKAKCDAQKAELLTMELSCLRNELLKRDLEINDYDSQYKQLMFKMRAFKNNGYRLQPFADLDIANVALLKA